jgi:hypothetical protein
LSGATVRNQGGEQSRKVIATVIIPLSRRFTRLAARTNGLKTPQVSDGLSCARSVLNDDSIAVSPAVGIAIDFQP